jgi:hypothetical protein
LIPSCGAEAVIVRPARVLTMTEMIELARHDVRTTPARPARKLDFLIPCFDRPKCLHHILRSGLALGIPGVHFVVFDDQSTLVENVEGLGPATVETVCRSFATPRVIYSRNPRNMGAAQSLRRYYAELCDAEYAALLNPKDEFISAAPIIGALAKLDADPRLSFVVYPLRQIDRVSSDRPLLFDYKRMSGRDFVACHVRDPTLQHASSYAILRVSAARKVGIPRDLGLRSSGIDDGSGIDHDIVFTVATTGDVDFESEPPLRRCIVNGYTERFPLSFAYSQYLYARRLMAELEPAGFVTPETRRLYLSWWHLLIARGLVVAYRPVHGSELEIRETRIRPHLRMPVLVFLPLECLRLGVWPRAETITTCLRALLLMLTAPLRALAGPLRMFVRRVRRGPHRWRLP